MTPTIEYKLYFGHSSTAVPQGEVTTVGVRIFLKKYAADLEGYTLILALGSWHGQTEQATILVVVGDSSIGPKIRALAEKYAEIFAQESVLLTATNITAELVTPPQELVTREQVQWGGVS